MRINYSLCAQLLVGTALCTPNSGYWYVAVDVQRLRGSTRASVRVVPRALPEIQEYSLSEVPSLGRDNIPPPAETGGEMHDVFISHASEDKDDFVRALASALINEGLNVWYNEMSGVMSRKHFLV